MVSRTGARERWPLTSASHDGGQADVGYAEFAKRLTEAGLPETEGSVTVKINRGPFPAWFLLAAMHVVGAHTLRLE